MTHSGRLTADEGNYALTVVAAGSGVTDDAGNVNHDVFLQSCPGVTRSF